MTELAEDKARGSKQRNWVGLVPYGLNEQHPNNYMEIADSIWENHDNLGYALSNSPRRLLRRLFPRHHGNARLDNERHSPVRCAPAIAAPEHYARHGLAPVRGCRLAQ